MTVTTMNMATIRRDEDENVRDEGEADHNDDEDDRNNDDGDEGQDGDEETMAMTSTTSEYKEDGRIDTDADDHDSMASQRPRGV